MKQPADLVVLAVTNTTTAAAAAAVAAVAGQRQIRSIDNGLVAEEKLVDDRFPRLDESFRITEHNGSDVIAIH